MSLFIQVASIQSRERRGEASDLVREYTKRLRTFAEISVVTYDTEDRFWADIAGQAKRTVPVTVLLDSRGKLYSSENFAGWLGRERDSGRQAIVFAVGPANGWSEESRERADLLLSLGPMTLPHELARVVLIEQIYRAFTILTGHPYHTGH